MARIALITTGITSHLSAGFELARRVQCGGHVLRFFVPSSQAAARVSAQGFAVHPVSEALAHEPLRSPRERARAQLARMLNPEALAHFVGEFEPDLVLVQSELHAGILWLLGQGIAPLLIDVDTVPRMRGVPPPNSSYTPRGRRRDELACRALWGIEHGRRRLRRGMERLRLGGLDAMSRWQAVARSVGVDFGAVTATDQWPVLHYPGLDYLRLSATELDFPAGQRSDAGRVGPMVYRERREPADHPDVQQVRAALAARGPDSPPLVLCAMGSILNLPSFSERIATAARGAAFEVWLAARDVPEDLPANVRVFGYVPQLEVLANASAAICHGGIATVNECIDNGVPMLVCPAPRLDATVWSSSIGVAARVAFHGLGRRASLRASPAALRAALDELLGGRSRAQRVREFRERIAHYERDNRVLHAIAQRLPQRDPISAQDWTR